jgi:hypothetical protein
MVLLGEQSTTSVDWLIWLAWGPMFAILAGLLGGAIVAYYIHTVTLPRLDRIRTALEIEKIRIDKLESQSNTQKP